MSLKVTSGTFELPVTKFENLYLPEAYLESVAREKVYFP